MVVRNKTNLLTLIIGTILLILAGTYAYFISNTFHNDEIIKINAGTMELTFKNIETENILGNLKLGDSINKYFEIENSGSLDAIAKISFDKMINTYTDGSLTYQLFYSHQKDEDSYMPISTNIVSNKIPVSFEESKKILANGLVIPAETKLYYKLTIVLNYLNDIDQTTDIDAIFYTNFTLEQGNRILAT